MPDFEALYTFFNYNLLINYTSDSNYNFEILINLFYEL